MRRIERALISVYDKSGIVEFAAALSDLKVQIISTGGTSRLLRLICVLAVPAKEAAGATDTLPLPRLPHHITVFPAQAQHSPTFAAGIDRPATPRPTHPAS